MKGTFYAKAKETYFMRAEYRPAVHFPNQTGTLSATDSKAAAAICCQVSAPPLMKSK